MRESFLRVGEEQLRHRAFAVQRIDVDVEVAEPLTARRAHARHRFDARGVEPGPPFGT